MTNKITIIQCSPNEYSDYIELLHSAERTIPFTQAPFYGRWQERDGKIVVYFAALQGDNVIASGLAVKYDAPGGISFFYSPYGPVAQGWSTELLAELRAFFTPIAKQTGTSFVRFDNDLLGDLPEVHVVTNKLAATASLQSRAEWLLDISSSQEDIWMGLHKHARYNVRLAERANVKLEIFEPDKTPLDTFLGLMQTTAKRDSFGAQTKQYYKSVLECLPADSGFVIICTIDNKPAAAAIFAAYDGVLHYVFAGSSDDFRKIAPPYYVIWNGILEAKRRGLNTLNFGGITEDVKGQHLAGVTGFKKRFGGYSTNHPNPVDLVYNRTKYALFKLYKTLFR